MFKEAIKIEEALERIWIMSHNRFGNPGSHLLDVGPVTVCLVVLRPCVTYSDALHMHRSTV